MKKSNKINTHKPGVQQNTKKRKVFGTEHDTRKTIHGVRHLLHYTKKMKSVRH